MTDREMLEMAAKAAGCSGLGMWDEKLGCLWDGEGWSFDPLNDDGDALRLAVKLELDVMHRVVGGKRVEVLAAGGPLIQEFYEGKPHAATRRAIVRAAAEIGRATKEA